MPSDERSFSVFQFAHPLKDRFSQNWLSKLNALVMATVFLKLMKRDLLFLVSTATSGLFVLSLSLSVLVQCGLVDPASTKFFQEKADLARKVLAPIEYCLKQRDKNRRK
jgi:hypothetical protein